MIGYTLLGNEMSDILKIVRLDAERNLIKP